MINGTIYIHSNRDTGKVYVGQTIKPIENRWRGKDKSYKTSSFFHSAIKKYGWDSFDHQIVVENVQTQDELDNLEKLWILCLQSTNSEFGYNLEAGGGNGKPNAEARKRMSEGQKRIGNKPPSALGLKRSEETKAKMRIALKGSHGGNPAWNRGLKMAPLSEERKRKISEINTGRKHTEETKEKCRAIAALRSPDFYERCLATRRMNQEKKRLENQQTNG